MVVGGSTLMLFPNAPIANVVSLVIDFAPTKTVVLPEHARSSFEVVALLYGLS